MTMAVAAWMDTRATEAHIPKCLGVKHVRLYSAMEPCSKLSAESRVAKCVAGIKPGPRPNFNHAERREGGDECRLRTRLNGIRP